jgi:small subunit ribosomal protein S10
MLGEGSPHVNKDSREQFEIREHTRLIDFLYPTALTFEFLNQLDIPAGVSLILKVISPFEVKSDGVVIA